MDTSNFLQWRIEYSVGIPEIDRQHKEIMVLINNLLTLCKEDTGNHDSFTKLVFIIREHFRKHFETEENLMLEKNYPQYESHKKRHDHLLEDIEKMTEKIMNEEQKASLLNMVIFLREWFVENIYGADKQMGEYFNQAKASLSA
jgi:hemerythrin